MSFNIKILTAKALIISALLFSFSTASAQYKLELEWQKEPGGGSYYINSITKSDNDSLLYIAGGDNLGKGASLITLNCSDGNVQSTKVLPFYFSKIIMSRNGKVLTASGNDNSFLGILDPVNFEISSSFSVPNIWNHTYNEQQNKIVACGSSFIEIYDVETRKKIISLGSEYFPDKNKDIKNASITNDGKFIIYSTDEFVKKTDGSNNWEHKYHIKIIDTQGNNVYNIGETTVPTFQFRLDGKKLVYFKTDGIHLFDLINFQDETGFPDTPKPSNVEMSSDDKFMLAGGRYCNFETKQTCSLSQIGTDPNFRLNFTNSRK